ncbi:hypothetical protein PILCRDRAFT_16238 [Piloderma croceum F 1598]|uniref:Uncharacterized protein n=1 Tax=Piloderma croceum (strain F 1598) TaxID=765440 RepID=A0A0C3EX40_PILCF|nr:hypothetical protein PILCRDRAFT_16238 [Piloderma croceum F 1598]
MAGGPVTSQNPPPSLAFQMQPKTKPQWLGFSFFGPAATDTSSTPHHHHLPPSPSVAVSHSTPETELSRYVSPTTTTTSLPAPHHHFLPSPSTAVLHGTPETELSRLVSWFSAPSLPPALHLLMQHPTTATISSASPHHLHPSPSATLSIDTPETKPHGLIFQDCNFTSPHHKYVPPAQIRNPT